MLKKRFAFVNEIGKLKEILRVNLLRDGSRRENSAEHSWHLAMMTLVYMDMAEGPVDPLKVVKMALVHDIVEIDAGDTYAFDDEGLKEKENKEKQAAKRLFDILPQDIGENLRSLWYEFEDLKTEEARFVRALDRLNPFMSHMENEGIIWKEKKMTKTLLMSRMMDVKEFCPKLFPYIEESVKEAIGKGWILDR